MPLPLRSSDVVVARLFTPRITHLVVVLLTGLAACTADGGDDDAGQSECAGANEVLVDGECVVNGGDGDQDLDGVTGSMTMRVHTLDGTLLCEHQVAAPNTQLLVGYSGFQASDSWSEFIVNLGTQPNDEATGGVGYILSARFDGRHEEPRNATTVARIATQTQSLTAVAECLSASGGTEPLEVVANLERTTDLALTLRAYDGPARTDDTLCPSTELTAPCSATTGMINVVLRHEFTTDAHQVELLLDVVASMIWVVDAAL